jgi:23S rRNA (uracil1939-C5)-methyltransferase
LSVSPNADLTLIILPSAEDVNLLQAVIYISGCTGRSATIAAHWDKTEQSGNYMSEKQIYRCEIVDLSHDGRGVGRIDGKACFIEGALPDETVEFRYVNRKRNYDEGRVSKVIEPASYRVEPSCKHFSRCGGCSLQHLEHGTQLKFKQQQLIASLEREGLVADSILPPLSAPPWGYRRRARLAVQRAKDGRYLIGFRNAGSRRIEPITQCPVLAAPLPQAVKLLPAWLACLPDDIRIFEVELISADSSFAIAVEASRFPADEEIPAMRDSLVWEAEGPVQLWWKAGKQARFTCLDTGTDSLSYAVAEDINLKFEPGQFIQVNGQINRDMIDQMLNLLPEAGDTAVDLYCGTGNLSLPLSRRFKQVMGIEGLPDLVNGAISNAADNNIDNVEFTVADLSRGVGLVNFGEANRSLENIDLIVVDPPRNGAAGVMPWVVKSGAQNLIYISCHPSTMARDSGVLAEAGYRLKALGVMDMFPHTIHIEAMAFFEKSTGKG